jgi:hypothetical protein
MHHGRCWWLLGVGEGLLGGLKDGLVMSFLKFFRSVWGIDVQKLQTGSQ